MPKKDKEEVLSRAALSAAYKAIKKKLKRLKETTSSNTTSIDELKNRLDDIERREQTLMHNLRLVLRKLDMKPEFPKRDE